MRLNTSKKYTVRVHYLDVKSNNTDSIEENDVELEDIPKMIKAMISSITICSGIFDLTFIITNIEVKLNKCLIN